MENIEEIIKKISALAKLEFTEEELKVLTPQFEKIVDYITILDKFDLEGVEPLTHVNEFSNIFRNDLNKEALNQKEVFLNAKKHNKVFFKVPKVIE